MTLLLFVWHVSANDAAVLCAITHALSSQLRIALKEQAQQLLQGPQPPPTPLETATTGTITTDTPTAANPSAAGLLMSLLSNVVWPALRPTSASQLSLTISLLSSCLAAADVALPGAPPGFTPSTVQQRLNKLCDLLDKAGGALHGLALAPILRPLLRTLLGAVSLPQLPTDLPPPPPSLHQSSTTDDLQPSLSLISHFNEGTHSGGGGTAVSATATRQVPPGLLRPAAGEQGGPDAALPALAAAAQAAVMAYASAATVGAAGKLLKALQVSGLEMVRTMICWLGVRQGRSNRCWRTCVHSGSE